MPYYDLDQQSRSIGWNNMAQCLSELVPNPTQISLSINAHHKNHWQGEELMANDGDVISANWAGPVEEIETATTNDSFWHLKATSPNDSNEIWGTRLFRLVEWLNQQGILTPEINFVNLSGAWLKSLMAGEYADLELSFTDLSGATLPLQDSEQGWDQSQFPTDGDYSIVTSQTPKFWALKVAGDNPKQIFGVNLNELLLSLDPPPVVEEPQPEDPGTGMPNAQTPTDENQV